MSNEHTNTTTRINPGAAVMWASACLILALVIMQAGSVTAPGGSAAYANTVSSRGDFTIMTVPAGNVEEALVILDSRDENIYTYMVEARKLVLQDVRSVKEMFEIAGSRANTRR